MFNPGQRPEDGERLRKRHRHQGERGLLRDVRPQVSEGGVADLQGAN